MSAPNQRTIKVNKTLSDKNHIYAILNIAAIERAAYLLTPTAFKLWLYLAKNQDGYTFEFYKVDAMKFGNFSERAYPTAFKELVNNGYLKETSKNHYSFYELPLDNEPIIIEINKAAAADNMSGFKF